MEKIITIITIIILLIPIAIFINSDFIKEEKYKSNEPKKTQKNTYQKNYNCVYKQKKYISKAEINYAHAIQKAIPINYRLFPQICLASIIEKESNNKYQNELYRIIDFGIFDNDFNIKILIEINDPTHHNPERIERDKKVKEICAIANIPIITLWTEYGINEDYIKKRISEYI